MCRCFLRRHCVIRTSSFCRTALACTAAPAMVGGATCFSDFALLLSASMRVQPLFCLCILKFRNTIQSHNDDIACCDQKGLVFSLASHTSRIFCTCVSAFRASALRNYVSHPKCLAYTRKRDWILSCIFGNWFLSCIFANSIGAYSCCFCVASLRSASSASAVVGDTGAILGVVRGHGERKKNVRRHIFYW
jgi:hypothetical protein